MTETMKVGVVTQKNHAEVMQVNKPQPKGNEVLVKMTACALCTYEQRIFTGEKDVPLPYVGGHEVSGVIEALGEGVSSRWHVGQLVALRTFGRCGECYYCHIGEDTMCDGKKTSTRQVPEVEGIGGLAEYFLATSDMLYGLDPTTDPLQAALTEPLSCVMHSLDQAEVDFGETVLIVGAGIMGLLHMQLANLRGAVTIVVEPDAKRRAKAKEMGAHYVLDPINEDLAQKSKEFSKGDGIDVVFYTPANAKLVESYIPLCAKHGRIVLYGSFHPDTPIEVKLNTIHYQQLRIMGAVNPGTKDFARASRMINQQIIDLSQYIDETVNIDNIQEAFEKAVSGGRYRVVVTF